MDTQIVGRNPSAPVGLSFDASHWSWRPILDLVVCLCGDLVEKEVLREMEFHAGQGPTNHETCAKMVARFERWMEHHVAGHEVDLDLRITNNGEFVLRKKAEENPNLETRSAYRVDDETLKDWIEFLRYCGGFEVW